MSRGVIPLTAALVLTSVLAITAPANATTFCLGVADPGCTAEGTLQNALNAAAADAQATSVVEIGPGTVPELQLQYPVPSVPGHTTTIVGASGNDPTVLTHASGDPHPVFECFGGALTLHNLKVQVPAGATTAGVTGDPSCSLTLDTVTVDGSQGTGTAVNSTGTLTVRSSTITAAPTATAVSIAPTAASTFQDSTITGATALLDLGPAAVTAHRLTLSATGAANAGAAVQSSSPNATLAIDDSLIRTATGASALHTISGTTGRTSAITARQITAVAGDVTVATPFWAHSDLGTSTISVYDSIASGYGEGVVLEGAGTSAAIDLHHTVLTSPATPAVATGTTTYAHSDDVLDIATHAPLFVAPATGNFHLGAASTLIDEDATALTAGESTTDLFGKARIVGSKRDLGAIEHQPPTASASAAATAKIGQPVAFSGTGASDAGPANFSWNFGDGATATGASPTHAYAAPGDYHWTLTVGDTKGTTTSAAGDITITASPPTVSSSTPDAITATTVTLHGTVNPNGAATVYRFDYGATATYGGQSTQAAIGAGTSVVAAAATISNLQPNHVYHWRIVAIQGATPVYGSDQTFSTAPGPPGGPSSGAGGTTTTKPTTKSTNKPAVKCKVPRLTNKTLAQARKALTKANCRLGTVKKHKMRTHHGRVVTQQRKAGRTYARNTKIGVTVGK
jgi:PKD repeat protein